MTYKFLLLLLIFLFTLGLISAKPGVGNLQNYYQLTEKYASHDKENRFQVLIKYPPLTDLIFSTLIKNFPIDKSNPLFGNQKVFIIFKFVLFSFYFPGMFSFLFFARGKKKLIPIIDLCLIYFSAFSLILVALGQSFFSIFSLPPFLLSMGLLIRKKYTASLLLYLISSLFNWSLLIFLPIMLIYQFRRNKQRWSSILVVFIYIFLIIFLIYFPFLSQNQELLFARIHTNTFNLPWLINFILYLISSEQAATYLNLFSNLSIKTMFIFLTLISIKFVFIKELSLKILLRFLFASYLIYILFFPAVSEGNLIMLPVLSMLMFTINRKAVNKYRFLTANILTSLNIYLFYGLAGISLLRNSYYIYFRNIFFVSFIFFLIWELYHMLSNKKTSVLFYKLTLISTLLLFVVYLFPSPGSSDHISWTQYALASLEYPNPFRAYNEVILQYPPISIVIISFFTHLWKTLVGKSLDYILAIKLSVTFFYALMFISYLKFSNIFSQRKKLSTLCVTFIFLTTFSLLIQTIGLDDLNVYIFPSLVVAIIALLKKKYLVSGLLLGLTIAIKWQPTILLPVFLATIFDIRNLKKSIINNLLCFIVGLTLIPTISWYLALIQPNGIPTIQRSFAFFFEGAAALSGRALNLNWIVTYVMHWFEYQVETLEHLGWINREIPKGFGPKIFQGQLFFLSSGLVMLKYWLKKKKTTIDFLTTSILIFFSHQILNKSAYEKHIFYTTALMLLLYLINPTKGNRKLLYLFDLMTFINLVFFLGVTGGEEWGRLLIKMDVTIPLSVWYVVIYLWVFGTYLKSGSLPLAKKTLSQRPTKYKASKNIL